MEHFLNAAAVVALPPALQPDQHEAPAYRLTADGLPQGDPLSAPSLLQSWYLEYKQNLPADLQATAYVDDVIVSGMPADLDNAWVPLQRGLQSMGYTSMLQKVVFGCPKRVQLRLPNHSFGTWRQHALRASSYVEAA